MMCCCLCLKDSKTTTQIFDENGQENIAIIITKHFWFETIKNDPLFTAICTFCWAKLKDFHEFYEMVEDAHQRYRLECISVKTEPSAVVDFASLSKDEEINSLNELDEVPFSTSFVITKKTNSKSLMPEDSSSTSPSPLRGNNKEDDYYLHDFDIDEINSFQNDSENSDPFDEATLTRNKVSGNSEPLTSQGTARVNKKKLKVTAKISNALVFPEENDKLGIQTKTRRKKLGLDEKPVSEIEESKSKKNRRNADLKKNPGEESDYKRKMKLFDAEIAQYMGLHCDVCNIALENFAGVKIHMRSEHNIDNGYVKCCDKKFHKRANLLHHIRHHVDPNCYRCDECGQTLNDYQSLRNHLFIKHQKDEDKIFECTECPKKFAKKYLLEQHRTFKHKERFKQCKTCNRRYKTLEELKEHNKEPCTGGRMCDICAKVIFGPGAFKRHQLEHEDGQAQKVQCDMCGSWHKDKYALRKHKRRHLEPKTPHTCDICQKVSPSRDAMESHKKYAHRSERTFECEFCQKSFKRPRSLREHISTHTGASLYTCPHCPKTFNSNANMHSHRKNVHPIEFEEARKRRQRTTLFGNNASVLEALKSKMTVDDKDMMGSDLSHNKTNDSITLYNTNNTI